MPDDDAPNPQETSIIRGSAIDPLNSIFEKFMSQHTPFGFHTRQDSLEFHPIPYVPEPDEKFLLVEPWRVILELYADDQRQVVGLDLHGDLILGRGESRPGRIIFNLDPYKAVDRGVSREHLMIRPTKTHLFAIDQGSTNGTTVNGAASGRGVATILKDQDLLSLGNMLLQLHMVKKPSTSK
jgi:FHA domain-containing protein